MKLLFINYEFPPLGGGGGRANAQMAKEMAALGHDVLVLTSKFKDLPSQEEKEGYRIVRIPTLRKHKEKCRIYEMAAFMVSSFFHTLKWVRSFRPDRTIAFFTIPCGPSAYLAKLVYKVPYIISLRGGDVPGFMKEQLALYHTLLLPVIRFLWRKALYVVANSEGLKEMASKAERKVPIEMIPNGVDTSLFRLNLSEDEISLQNFNPEKFNILSVGRMTPQKGFDVLLEAMLQLKDKGLPIHLTLVGDGPERKDLETMVRTFGLKHFVSFAGWIEQEGLKNFYAKADLFVLPSLYEGMPNVVLEAMAAGLPVIATDIAGSREIVLEGENGYLVSPGDAQKLAEKIIHLAHKNDLLDTMAKASQRMALDFNWQTVAKGYLELCG
ncbi:MAG TPA: glycosyltransferase family 4 protein [Deltaproteobacteria bacterium]|nr:MAG: hypothetical protein A2048_08025 [Deltaproteobacteria bacterium GWA2_45_12]HBF13387.1 glycosyltransferase family 4 protein [Deltaproteobacteria bacterium]